VILLLALLLGAAVAGKVKQDKKSKKSEKTEKAEKPAKVEKVKAEKVKVEKVKAEKYKAPVVAVAPAAPAVCDAACNAANQLEYGKLLKKFNTVSAAPATDMKKASKVAKIQARMAALEAQGVSAEVVQAKVAADAAAAQVLDFCSSSRMH
jgi:hypothetical protein